MTTRALARRTWLRTTCCVAAVGLLVGCGTGPGAAAAVSDTATSSGTAPLRDTAALTGEAVELAGISLARADSVPWRETWRATGRLVLDPAATQSLGAVAEGRVSRVLVSVGDRVTAGQPLVAIHSHEMTDARSDAASAVAADASAETALTVARSAAARAERLLALKALSAADSERARAELAHAEARRVQAIAELARTRARVEHLGGGTSGHEVIARAPMAGVVVSRAAQPGTVVLVGAPLVTISQATRLLLSLQLPEQAATAVRLGASVRFDVSAAPGARFDARVERVAPTIDSVTRTIAVLARPVGNVGALRAEMYGTAELFGADGASALVVPAASLQAMEGDTIVVTARERADGMLLEAVRVRVGRRTAEHAEILAGLAPGTPVVTQGAAIAKAEILRRRGGE